MRFVGKLNAEQQLKICEMLARFQSLSEIRKTVDKWGITLNDQAIDYYRVTPKWKAVIDRLRSEYLTEILEVPIAHKRVRLERLDYIYKTALGRGQLSVAKEVLKAAQEEIEHKPGQVSLIMNKIELISDDELKSKIRRIKEELLHIEDKSFMNAEEAALV